MKRDFILNDLFVHQDFRNQGLAKSLMSFIMEFASRNSIRSINLETAPSNNAAQSLYDSLGWRSDKILNSDGYFKYTWAP
jgi:ribosomal protein S18 acetylase RimI-like enzyme